MDRIGKYVIHKLSVTTGYAQVVFCHDPDLQVPVAVKLFDPRRVAESPMSPAQWLARFVSEARAMASVDHTYVTPVKALEQLPDGRPYFVMPYFAAHLAFEIGHDGVGEADGPRKLSLQRTILLMRQLSAALASMHRKGMVHRWVKPSNVLLTAKEGGAVRLADFSMVKFPGANPPMPDIWPDQGPYVAPEQRENATGVGSQADVYSVGALAYRLISGKVPDAKGLDGLDNSVEMPQELWDLIAQCMDPDPLKRPLNGGLVLSMFEGVPLDGKARKVETVMTKRRTSSS